MCVCVLNCYLYLTLADAEAEAPAFWSPDGPLMQTDNSLEKSLMLGKTEGRRRRGHQRMQWLDGMNMNLGKLWKMVRNGKPGVL